MAGDLPEAFLGDRPVPLQPLSRAFDPTGPTLQQRWPCSGAPAGLLIFTLPSQSSLLSWPALLIFFSNPHLKRQCCGSHINNIHFLTRLRSYVMEGKMGEVDWAASRERTLRQKGRSQVQHLLHLWVQTLPLSTPRRLLPLRLRCVVLCQRMPWCISIDVSAPAATARPLSSRTPTVASGTVIFVNATPVASHNSPEWSGPNKHRHGRFCLFFTLFSGHGEWSPDPEATFKHYQIRNESQANSESRLSSRDCLQRQTRTEESTEK